MATNTHQAVEGTADSFKWIDDYVDINGGDRMQSRFFTYRADVGVVAGKTMSVTFTVDRPARDVWPYLKDFNLWQNAAEYYYSGVVGDLEGHTFRLSSDPNDNGPHQYEVVRVIPEYLIVLYQPVPKANDIGGRWAIGEGGVSGGFHAIGLEEVDGGTIISFRMQHASVMASASQADELTEEEAIAPWRTMSAATRKKWRDIFIPSLRKLVYDNSK
jgi:hypothetical protein